MPAIVVITGENRLDWSLGQREITVLGEVDWPISYTETFLCVSVDGVTHVPTGGHDWLCLRTWQRVTLIGLVGDLPFRDN